MTKDYYNELFRPLSHIFRELAEPNGRGLTGHKLGDGQLGLAPKQPSQAYTLSTAPINAVQAVLDYYQLIVDQREYADQAFKNISAMKEAQQIARSLPQGTPFTIYIHDPGTLEETVVVHVGSNNVNKDYYGEGESSAGQAPDNRLFGGTGTGDRSLRPTAVSYRDAQGRTKVAPVYGVMGWEHTNPFVQREPRGDGRPHDVISEGGPLPADGRLDGDHPGHIDGGGLA